MKCQWNILGISTELVERHVQVRWEGKILLENRAITLVGENERLILKEILKHNSIGIKSRLIPYMLIETWMKRIQNMEEEMKELLKEEVTVLVIVGSRETIVNCR